MQVQYRRHSLRAFELRSVHAACQAEARSSGNSGLSALRRPCLGFLRRRPATGFPPPRAPLPAPRRAARASFAPAPRRAGRTAGGAALGHAGAARSPRPAATGGGSSRAAAAARRAGSPRIRRWHPLRPSTGVVTTAVHEGNCSAENQQRGQSSRMTVLIESSYGKRAP